MAFNGYHNPELQTADTGPNALDIMRSAVQLRGAQQENQQRDLAIQQQTRQVQDDTTIREAYGRNKGDVDKTLQDIAGKVSPQAFQAAQQHAYDLKQKAQALVSQQGDIALKQSDAMQGAHDVVDKAPADQKPIVYQQQLQGLHQMGVDVSQMPPQYPGDEQFKTIGLGIKTHSKLMEDAAKQADAAKANAQAAEAAANQKKTEASMPGVIAEGKIKQAEADSLSQGGMTQSMADSRYRVISQRKALGQPVNPDDNAFLKTYEKQKTLNATTTFNLQNAGATGQGGQPSAIAQSIASGQMKWQDAVSPRTPMQVKEALLKEIKGINPNFNSGDFTVEQKVREKYTSGNVSDQLLAINTAREHMKTFGALADALDNGNVQAANSIGNAFGVQFGSDKATNFKIAAQAFGGEVGKALDGAHVTAGEREQAASAFNANMSPAQFRGAVKTVDSLLQGKQKAANDAFKSGTQGKPNFGNQPEAPKGMIQARDPQGKLHQAPAGTALPAGWKLEQ